MGTVDFTKMNRDQKLSLVKDKAPHLEPIVEAMLDWRERNPQIDTAVVTTYFDRSGSTEDTTVGGRLGGQRLYSTGIMSEVSDYGLAAAVAGFDSDGEVPVWFFHNTVADFKPGDQLVSLDNCIGLMDRNSDLPFGGTYYIPVLRHIVKQTLITDALLQGDGDRANTINGWTDQQVDAFIKPETETSWGKTKDILRPLLKLPVAFYARVITDGEPLESHGDIERYLCWMSQLGIFVGFEGVGNHKFVFLKKLNDLKGRFIDNVGFFDWKDTRKIKRDANGKPIPATVVATQLDEFGSKFVPNARNQQLIA